MVAQLFALTAALVSGRGMPIAGTRMRTTGAVALATPFTFDGRSSTISPYDNTNFQLARYGSSPVYSPVSMATSMYGGGGMMNSMYGGYGGYGGMMGGYGGMMGGYGGMGRYGGMGGMGGYGMGRYGGMGG